MKLLKNFILINIVLASCSSPSEKKAKDPIGNYDSINAAKQEAELRNEEMELLRDSIEDSLLDEKTLKKEYYSERKKRIDLEQNLEIHTHFIDSLTKVINSKDNRIATLLKNQYKQPEDDEIESLITNLHAAINKLRTSEKEVAVLKYFLPQFSIKHVMIDSDNLGHIAAYNHEDYKKHLKDLTRETDIRHEIIDIKILDIETKENTFFNVLYRLKSKSFEKESLKHNINTMVSLTGKKMDGALKIASFSVVEFQY